MENDASLDVQRLRERERERGVRWRGAPRFPELFCGRTRNGYVSYACSAHRETFPPFPALPLLLQRPVPPFPRMGGET